MDYFAANDLSAFKLITGTITENTTAGGSPGTSVNFDNDFTDRAITFNSTNNGTVESAKFINPSTGATVSLTDFWFRFDMRTLGGASTANQTMIEFYNSTGTPVLRVVGVDTAQTNFRIDYWNGASWVAGATTGGIWPGAVGAGTLRIWDFHIVCGVSGSVDLYGDLDPTPKLTQSGLNAAVNNISYFRLYARNASGQLYSQFLASDVSTVGAKVANVKPTAAGTNTAWAGTYTDIIKTGYNDTTMISSSTLSDKESYVAADLSVLTGYTVSSMWFDIRARLNSTSPANIKPLVRIGGTDYAGGYNFSGLSAAGFLPSIAAFEKDPSTTLDWTITNINLAEVGYQVAA